MRWCAWAEARCAFGRELFLDCCDSAILDWALTWRADEKHIPNNATLHFCFGQGRIAMSLCYGIFCLRLSFPFWNDSVDWNGTNRWRYLSVGTEVWRDRLDVPFGYYITGTQNRPPHRPVGFPSKPWDWLNTVTRIFHPSWTTYSHCPIFQFPNYSFAWGNAKAGFIS